MNAHPDWFEGFKREFSISDKADELIYLISKQLAALAKFEPRGLFDVNNNSLIFFENCICPFLWTVENSVCLEIIDLNFH